MINLLSKIAQYLFGFCATVGAFYLLIMVGLTKMEEAEIASAPSKNIHDMTKEEFIEWSVKLSLGEMGER